MIKLLFAKAAPEWIVAEALLLLTLFFQYILQAPLQWFSISSLTFVETNYLLPFGLLCIWIVLPIPFFRQKRSWLQVVQRLGQQLGDVVCFTLILWLHFHIKLWIPLIHPVSYDQIYEAIDRNCFSWLDPIIAWRSHLTQIEWVNHLYVNLFIGMFLCSFVIHNLRGRSEFRRVFLASLLVQAMGAISYLIAPAVGPFLYHSSANAWTGEVEGYLYNIRLDMLAGGIDWLKANTGQYLACGLAAMPSLHVAASFVFLHYAWRHCRWLTLLYGPAFAWIIFEAMASRWHYAIDLVAGMALACGSIALANLWMRAHEAAAQTAIFEPDNIWPLPEECPTTDILGDN